MTAKTPEQAPEMPDPRPVQEAEDHTIRPPDGTPTNPIASVTSQPQPQPGQKNRSSGNFSTQDAPSGTRRIQWFVTENDNYDQIVFNVMQDKKLWFDPVIFKNVRNGDITDYKDDRQLYIANPQNAGGQTFIVQAWPVFD